MSATISSLQENPAESVNWRRHRNGCPFYRVRWFANSDPSAGEPMYQVYCMMNTPPESFDEQEKCLASRSHCWRTAGTTRQGQDAAIPVSSVRRRKPA